jgi:hypothetical protein
MGGDDDNLGLDLVGWFSVVGELDEVIAGNGDGRIRIHEDLYVLRSSRWRARTEPAKRTSTQYNPAAGKEQF